jgi:tetratricopeptide (TPR) repeat protein
MLLGRVHETVGDREAAAACYSRAIALAPNLETAYFNRGRAKLSMRNDTLELSPMSFVGRRVMHQGTRRAETERERSLRREAEQDFEEAARRGIERERLLLVDGWKALLEGRLEEASVSLQNYLSAHGTDADAHFMKAQVHQELLEFESAESHFRRAVALRPRFAGARFGRTCMLRALHRLIEAEAEATAYLDLRPNPALHGYVMRAAIRIEAKRLDEAEQDIRKALELNDRFPYAYYEQARLEHARGFLAAALRAIDQAIALEPSPDFYLTRGLIRMRAGDEPAAEKDFDEALLKNPNLLQAWVVRGEIRGHAGRWDEAIHDWTRAIELAPKDGTVHRLRGEARARVGDPAGAEADYTEAIKLGEVAKGSAQRGMIRMNRGEWAAALEDFRKAVESDPMLQALLRPHIEKCEERLKK